MDYLSQSADIELIEPTKALNQEECAICFENLYPSKKVLVRTKVCIDSHYFHKHCFNRAYNEYMKNPEQNQKRPRCLICQRNIRITLGPS